VDAARHATPLGKPLTRLRFPLAVAAVLACGGCVTTSATRADDEGVADLSDGRRKGVLHVVARGQTLYRIAKTYGITVQDLVEVNDLVDPSKLAVGAALWIPGAERLLDVPATVAVTPEPARPVRVEAPKIPEKRPDPTAPSPDDDPPEAPKVVLQRTRFAWPLDGRLSSHFGARGDGHHDGIDVLAPKGTPVRAADAGTVLFAGEQRGYGNLVLLKHADGLVTVYAHHDANKVRAGDVVSKGQTVGTVGRTGRASTDHLHFEVRVDRKARNPLFYLPERE